MPLLAPGAVRSRSGEFLPAAYSVLCTLQRSLWYFQENPHAERPANLKLGTLAQHFGIELDNAHDALADVRATVKLYKALTLTDSSDDDGK